MNGICSHYDTQPGNPTDSFGMTSATPQTSQIPQASLDERLPLDMPRHERLSVRTEMPIILLHERTYLFITPQIQGPGRQRGWRVVLAGDGFSDKIICERKNKEKRVPPNGLRYPRVGGTRQRHFAGTSSKPRKLPENAATPTRRVHAVLGGFSS